MGCDFVTAMERRPLASAPPLAEAASGVRAEAEAEALLGVIRQEVLCCRLAYTQCSLTRATLAPPFCMRKGRHLQTRTCLQWCSCITFSIVSLPFYTPPFPMQGSGAIATCALIACHLSHSLSTHPFCPPPPPPPAWLQQRLSCP